MTTAMTTAIITTVTINFGFIEKGSPGGDTSCSDICPPLFDSLKSSLFKGTHSGEVSQDNFQLTKQMNQMDGIA
jgi:hypothetical protein